MYLNGIEATGFSLKTPQVIKPHSDYFYDKIQNIRTIVYKKLIKNSWPRRGQLRSSNTTW